MNQYFTITEMMLLIRMLIAHLIVRFVLPVKLPRFSVLYEKNPLFFQILPALVESFVIYLLAGHWLSIWIFPFFFVFSIASLAIEGKSPFKPFRFILAEIMLLAGIALAWLSLILGFSCAEQAWKELMQNTHAAWIVLGYMTCLWPLDRMVSIFTRKWRIELPETAGLNEAGKWIGKLERVLILTFVLVGHFEAIGFLITAKSILRFNDLKQSTQKKEAEYILIGTLMSFSACIILGLLVLKLIENS